MFMVNLVMLGFMAQQREYTLDAKQEGLNQYYFLIDQRLMS